MRFSIQLIGAGPAQDFLQRCIFDEPTTALKHHLTELGHDVVSDGTGRPIFLNFHIVPKSTPLAQVPRLSEAIIYNQESYGNHADRWVMAAMAHHKYGTEVWDLRQANVAHWRDEFGVEAKYVPVGWAPAMAAPQYAQKPIDLLFYGALTDRRRAVMEYVQSRGYNVHFHYAGPSKQNLQGLSKITLSVRAYDHVDQVETIRLIQAMGSGCLCAFEGGAEDMGLTRGAIVESLEGLGPAIVYNLEQDDEYRKNVAETGREAAEATGPVMREWLAKALEARDV